MDDTTATPPTSATASASAAAVKADGANAAVNLKAAAAGAGNGTTNTQTPTSGTSVKLLIKASNQQYDDQIIESDLTWTVRRLKTHLSMVYPSKPPVAEQKLIYSGQLLNDLMLLKDVIRSYKDVYTQNHIIHLVYMPKSMTIPKPASKKTKAGTSAATDSTSSSTTTSTSTQDTNMLGGNSSTDGLRQRHVHPGLPGFHTMQQQSQRQFMQFAQFAGAMPGMAATPAHMSPMLAAAYMQQMQHTPAACYPPPSGANPAFAANSLAAQQMAMYNAWMQQVYAQYMEQYARLSSSATGTAGQSQSSDYLSAAMHAMQQHQMPFYHPNASTVIPTPPNMLPAFPPNFVGVNQANSVAEQQQPAAQAAAQEQQQQQQVAEQRRFPNIVQDEAENRDWLDSFFSLTRLAIFLTILYFNTSPLRCFIVLIIGGAIYLYHIGVLRIRTERNNNNINRNNNAERQIRQDQEQVQPAGAGNNPPNDGAAAGDNDGNGGDTVDAATDPLLPSSGTEDQLAPQENPSVIAFVRTLVISFFTSLLPETPAL